MVSTTKETKQTPRQEICSHDKTQILNCDPGWVRDFDAQPLNTHIFCICCRKISEGEKSEGEKSKGEKSKGEKPEGEKSKGEKPKGEKPEGEKYKGKILEIPKLLTDIKLRNSLFSSLYPELCTKYHVN